MATPTRNRSGIHSIDHFTLEIPDLEAARVRLNPLAALALAGDASRGGDVLPRLNAWGRRFADTYQTLNKGAHVAHAGELRALVGDAKALVAQIRTASL